MPTPPRSQSALDTAFDVLANAYRRRLLVALLEHDAGASVVPTDVVIENVPPEGRGVYLTHTHLPKLEDAGFIEWDREGEEVRAGPRFDEIRPLLELLDDHADELAYAWP